jgi:hypothetical protein
MESALKDFFRFTAGQPAEPLRIQDGGRELALQASGYTDVVCFVGHDGLMDMKLADYPKRQAGSAPAFIAVLACKSREYFGKSLADMGCPAVLTTTGLMAPEAYTLDALVRAWAKGSQLETIRLEAGRTYATYQKINARAGERVFAADAN